MLECRGDSPPSMASKRSNVSGFRLLLSSVERATCRRYTVRGLLGQGTFGQVVECTRLGLDGGAEQVAVKVIKNQSAYFQQVGCPPGTSPQSCAMCNVGSSGIAPRGTAAGELWLQQECISGRQSGLEKAH